MIPGGIVDFTHTILLWQSLLSVVVEIVVVAVVMWLATPTGAAARDAAALGIDLGPADRRRTPRPQADARANASSTCPSSRCPSSRWAARTCS